MQVFFAFQHRAADRRNLIFKDKFSKYILVMTTAPNLSNLDEFPLPIIFLKVEG